MRALLGRKQKARPRYAGPGLSSHSPKLYSELIFDRNCVFDYALDGPYHQPRSLRRATEVGKYRLEFGRRLVLPCSGDALALLARQLPR